MQESDIVTDFNGTEGQEKLDGKQGKQLTKGRSSGLTRGRQQTQSRHDDVIKSSDQADIIEVQGDWGDCKCHQRARLKKL